MSKPKFKLGDLVVLKDNVKAGDCINALTINPSMYKGLKKPCRIKRVYMDGSALVDRWFFPLDALKPFYPEKIIIYRNGAEVIAKNTSTDKTGVARCNPADEFDFNTGAKLAFERLMNPEPEKPKYYSGKVVCVSPHTSFYTKGKVYEIKDGVGKDDVGNAMTYRPVKSFKEFRQRMASEFVELVE